MIGRVDVTRGDRDLGQLTRLTPPNTWRGKTRNLLGLRRRRFHAILGLACTGHGASLALITAGGIIRSSVLDRWAGVKHVLMFSRDEDHDLREGTSQIDREIRYLLSLGFGRFPATRIFEDTIVEWLRWFLRDSGVTAADIDLVVTAESHFATCWLRLGTQLHRWFPGAWFSTGIEHHEIHQRQAFWQSGFDEAAVLTLDACGEPLQRLGGRALAGTIAAMDAGGGCRILKEILFPESSPGLLYDVVNRHVGFRLGDEGKTMGLAPYGERSDLLAHLESLLQLDPDGGYTFISHHELGRMLEDYVPARTPDAEISKAHMNIAYAGQALTEKIVENAFHGAMRLTGRRKLAYAGGVALNSVANEAAFRGARPAALYVCPSPGDTGHALGCALFGAYEIARWPAPLREVPEFLGPAYSERELAEAAGASGYPVTQPGEVADALARCIANGYITARFSGGAEFGPRALGNRSILCDPRPGHMKDYLNDRVKHREGFRPFAPAVLEEDAADWFEIAERSAYMLRVVGVRPECRHRIAATVHIDGTGRVQTVAASDNPGFYDVIRAFKSLTGVPVVLNTSFNIASKPIVETPRDAVECFNGTDIDVLALGPFLVTKAPLAAYRDVKSDRATSGASVAG